ncbi:MAG: DNA polymerase III subunit delta [Pyrinomonas sp.]|uniref:DNA polymerase III subunit delta n=1 Tax=Pyrinomonas sp. TaxID=2080306 RepID=UPI0033213182
MSLLTREELRRELKSGRLAPLYLLYGPEEYLRERAARAISDLALADSPVRDFNESKFDLAADDVQQAIATAQELPMLGGRRVVFMTNFARLREADEAALSRYIVHPAESSVVIFVADDIDKRKRLSKLLLERCVAVEFAPLKDDESVQWARARLKELGALADDRTLHHIVALVGPGVRRLAMELEKLATAALPEGQITMEHVEALTDRSRESSNFELADYLVRRDRKRALSILHRLLEDGVEPVMLLGLIANSYHRLALAKELMARGAPTTEVFRVVALPFSKREEFLATARRTDAHALTRALERIAAADLAIKTSQATPQLQLEILVYELTA